MLADRISPEVEFLGKGLIDDRDSLRAGVVASGKIATSENRHCEHSEEIRAAAVEPGAVVGVGIFLEAFDRDALTPVVAREKWNHRRGDTGDTGKCCQLLFHSREERFRASRVVTAQARRN